MTHAEPTAAEFEEIARRTLERLPEQFRLELQCVAIQVAEFATAEQLADVGIEDRFELTGLYEGTPLTEQSVWAATEIPPVISLFRQPLLLEMRETGVGFEELVRHVYIHEAGHHFGFSDEDVHALEEMVVG
jgi:predicted Zn-dependent protease with MMP-like domain